MDLVVDIGNSETVFGLVQNENLEMVDSWRIKTSKDRTTDEYESLLNSMINTRKVSLDGLRHTVVGSVVPGHTSVVVKSLENLFGQTCIVVNPESSLPITLEVEEPLTVGVDRIVNTLAAKAIYDKDVLVVDFGTATSFDCITADGVFIGGVIAQGLEAGIEWLTHRTAKLPSVELLVPERVIGKRTEECIQSGIFFSSVDSVDGIVRRIHREWGVSDLTVIVTGGYGELVGPHLNTANHFEPFLTLYGLALAGRFLSG
jgi:type III pantothenate kinase